MVREATAASLSLGPGTTCPGLPDEELGDCFDTHSAALVIGDQRVPLPGEFASAQLYEVQIGSETLIMASLYLPEDGRVVLLDEEGRQLVHCIADFGW